MNKRLRTNRIEWLLLMACLIIGSMTSCSVEHNEQIMSKPLESGSFTTSLIDGKIIKIGSNNLLSFQVDYPTLKVSSVFGSVTAAPKIKYLGQFDHISNIQLNINEVMNSSETQATNKGGYVITMSRREGSGTKQYFIRLRMVEHIGTTTADSSLDFEYQIFTTKESISFGNSIVDALL